MEIGASLVFTNSRMHRTGTRLEVRVALGVLPGVRMDRTAARLEMRGVLGVVLLGVQMDQRLSPSLKRKKI